MALLMEDGKYVRVLENGEYEIYPSLESRDRVKNATPYEKVIEKYQELFKTVLPDDEAYYYLSKEELNREFPDYIEWMNEFNRYQYDYQIKHGGGSYPLIEQYIPDVLDSIPEIIEAGSFNIDGSIDESYFLAKDRKLWRKTEDV